MNLEFFGRSLVYNSLYAQLVGFSCLSHLDDAAYEREVKQLRSSTASRRHTQPALSYDDGSYAPKGGMKQEPIKTRQVKLQLKKRESECVVDNARNFSNANNIKPRRSIDKRSKGGRLENGEQKLPPAADLDGHQADNTVRALKNKNRLRSRPARKRSVRKKRLSSSSRDSAGRAPSCSSSSISDSSARRFAKEKKSRASSRRRGDGVHARELVSSSDGSSASPKPKKSVRFNFELDTYPSKPKKQGGVSSNHHALFTKKRSKRRSGKRTSAAYSNARSDFSRKSSAYG